MTDPSTASRDLSLLAPKFRAAVEAAIADCAAQGFPVKVAEALRSQERQAWLYAQGRTRPGSIVTHASTNLTSWHGYGLAVDVIHETKGWAPGASDRETTAWFRKVADIFKSHGCSAGMDWSKADPPHMQWGNMPASPGVTHKAAKQSRGNAAVWRDVGAADPDFHDSESPHVKAPRSLKMGDSGDDVKALQTKLNLRADGLFGVLTERAVQSLQLRHGLAVDGIAGPHTLSLLEGA